MSNIDEMHKIASQIEDGEKQALANAPHTPIDFEVVRSSNTQSTRRMVAIDRERYEQLLEAEKDAERLAEALTEIRRLRLAPVTNPELPYTLLAKIDVISAAALAAHEKRKT